MDLSLPRSATTDAEVQRFIVEVCTVSPCQIHLLALMWYPRAPPRPPPPGPYLMFRSLVVLRCRAMQLCSRSRCHPAFTRNSSSSPTSWSHRCWRAKRMRLKALSVRKLLLVGTIGPVRRGMYLVGRCLFVGAGGNVDYRGRISGQVPGEEQFYVVAEPNEDGTPPSAGALMDNVEGTKVRQLQDKIDEVYDAPEVRDLMTAMLGRGYVMDAATNTMQNSAPGRLGQQWHKGQTAKRRHREFCDRFVSVSLRLVQYTFSSSSNGWGLATSGDPQIATAQTVHGSVSASIIHRRSPSSSVQLKASLVLNTSSPLLLPTSRSRHVTTWPRAASTSLQVAQAA